MSPNSIYSGFDRIFISSSSESSDSESFLLEDIKNVGNQTNKQWEAIERTLYQEPGQQVTDPELLKECKLWRETFPHFRVKGTKIDPKQTDNKLAEVERDLENLKNNFDLQKLEQKRESIKKKVVGELVERIIAKYGFQKEESANLEVENRFKNGVQISVIQDDCSEKILRNLDTSIDKNPLLSLNNPDDESYFERGKNTKKEPDFMTAEQMEKNLYEIFDSWEKDYKADAKLRNSQKLISSAAKENPVAKRSQKATAVRDKSKKFTLPSNSLPNVGKPFETIQKIDKKYEGLIERIIERKYNELDAIRHCPKSASDFNIMSYEESLKKLRKASGFDDYLKRKDTQKINKFNNNWMKKTEMSCYSTGDNPLLEKRESANEKSAKNFCTENSRNEADESLLEELKREMISNYRRPAKKTEVLEEISLRRPKPFAFTLEKKKVSNSKDLLKKNKKEFKIRQPQNELGTTKKELNFKKRVNSNNLTNSKRREPNGNQNQLLPPIETGIICRELTGPPKVGVKNPIKKF